MKRTKSGTTEGQLHQRRRGSLVMILIICLVLISVLGASLVRVGLSQRKQSRRESDRLQATWLAEAGVERAAAKLRLDAAYSGEEWELTKDQITDKFAGSVNIKVSSDEANANRRIISVTATYPTAATLQSRTSKEIGIDLTP